MEAPSISNPELSSAPLTDAHINAAMAAVLRTWPDERSATVALIAAVEGFGAEEVACWPAERLDAAHQAVADRLNAWADQSHEEGLARLSLIARKRRGKPLTARRIANLLAFHSPHAVAPSPTYQVRGTTNG